MSDLCDEVMPALVPALSTEGNPEVVERVAHGLDNCMEHMDEDSLAKYLPDIMPPLLGLISHADARMHDTLLSCISSAAAAGGEGFEPFAGMLFVGRILLLCGFFRRVLVIDVAAIYEGAGMSPQCWFWMLKWRRIVRFVW